MKRFFLPLVFFVACSKLQLEIPKDPYTLIYQMGGEPSVINPILGQDVFEGMISGLIYDNLIVRDNQTLDFIPKMAWRWEVSEDKLQYIFYLRKDMKWHDGVSVTADDVVFSYEKIRDPKVDAAHLRNYYQDIKKIEKIDDYTVKFIYARLYFRALEFVGGMPILPKHLYTDATGQTDFNAHPLNRHPVGNGPYKFVIWQPGQYIILEKNEDYWDKAKEPEMKKIQFQIVPNDAVSLQMLKKGDLDYMGLRPIQWVYQTKSNKFLKQFQKIEYPGMGYRYIGWNANRELFADRNVRMAMSHLINREAIVDKLEFGLASPTTGPFWPKGYGYNHALSPISFDPVKAKQLLKDAGWEDHDGDGVLDKNGAKFAFTFLTPAGNRFYERLGSIMKANMEKLGIQVEISRMEWSVFLQRLNQRDFDAVSLGWTGGFDPDPYQIWHSSQLKQGHNFVGFKNAEVDQLIEQARETFDKSARDRMFQRIHEIIYQEQPYTFLFVPNSLSALANRFTNVKIYPGGVDLQEWKLSAVAQGMDL